MSIRPRTPAPATPAPGKLPLPELAEMKRRGDTATVEAHLRALRAGAPHLEPMYRALAEATAP